MKTTVSIPDELFRRAEELARRLGKSRSQIYREALSDYVLRFDAMHVTNTIDTLVEELRREPDAWFGEAARGTLERACEW